MLRGNLFDSAVMKTSVISEEFRARYLANAADPDAFEGRAVIFDGPEQYRNQIDDPAPAIEADTILFMRGTGPMGFPGAAKVVNMRPPDCLIREGVRALPYVGDGRQSGTSNSASILNASPEAAIGGGMALVHNDDRIRIDLRKCQANILMSAAELAQPRQELQAAGGYTHPGSQIPWQEIKRRRVSQLDTRAVLEEAVNFRGWHRLKGFLVTTTELPPLTPPRGGTEG